MAETDPPATNQGLRETPVPLPPAPTACLAVRRTILVVATAMMVGQIIWYPAVLLSHRGAADRGEPVRFELDLNEADAREIALLPGIGGVLARRIELHRNMHGRFRSWDDVREVSGIGPKTIEAIKPLCRPLELNRHPELASRTAP